MSIRRAHLSSIPLSNPSSISLKSFHTTATADYQEFIPENKGATELALIAGKLGKTLTRRAMAIGLYKPNTAINIAVLNRIAPESPLSQLKLHESGQVQYIKGHDPKKQPVIVIPGADNDLRVLEEIMAKFKEEGHAIYVLPHAVRADSWFQIPKALITPQSKSKKIQTDLLKLLQHANLQNKEKIVVTHSAGLSLLLNPALEHQAEPTFQKHIQVFAAGAPPLLHKTGRDTLVVEATPETDKIRLELPVKTDSTHLSPIQRGLQNIGYDLPDSEAIKERLKHFEITGFSGQHDNVARGEHFRDWLKGINPAFKHYAVEGAHHESIFVTDPLFHPNTERAKAMAEKTPNRLPSGAKSPLEQVWQVIAQKL